MVMLFNVIAILACSHCAFSRDVGKMMRAGPSISNSLVNLGKMDISFYFGKPTDKAMEKTEVFSVLPSLPFPSPFMVEEPCLCTEFRSKMDSLVPQPSEIISKILRNNDLFKAPKSSVCCNSHEQVHEDTIFFELTNDPTSHLNQRGPMKIPSVPVEKMMTSPTFMRPKAVEIFLFPKRKDLTNFEFSKQSGTKDKKPVIKKVGKEPVSIPLPPIPLNEENNEDNKIVKKDSAIPAEERIEDLENKKNDDNGTQNVL